MGGTGHGRRKIEARTVAEALLALMKARGIDFLFANAGTDFPPIIEAYARAAESGLEFPTPLAVPHENVAVSMAHGHFLGSGRMQAAMVHVSVGMANSLCALMNAAREHVPVLFCAGRTPITEAGHPASRDVSIHWGQEMFDQAGMLREIVKWDYELRVADQVETVVDRAIAIGCSDPAGPVHLGLPREMLSEEIAGLKIAAGNRLAPVRYCGVDLAAVEAAAEVLAAAEQPLIVTSRAGRESKAARAAIPVVEYRANYLNLPSNHPMHAGFDFDADFTRCDAVLVLDTPAPWLPGRHAWPSAATVIQIGVDPLSTDIPIRGFPADIAIAARPSAALPALGAALERAAAPHDARIEGRRKRLADRHARAAAARRQALIPDSPPARLTAAWASHCLDRIKGKDAVVFNEIGCIRPVMRFTEAGTFFGPSNAGGLGWALPASLGYKLARPDPLVVACVGDGSHMFANPVACHQTAAANKIATLTLVFNNRRWDSVRTATASIYPEGFAMRANQMPLTALEPSPAYHDIAAACGAHAAAVEEPGALPHALETAIAEVRAGRPALLNLLID